MFSTDFIRLLEEQLGDPEEVSRLLNALENGSQPTSIRVNPHKCHPAPTGSDVNWCKWGRYLA